MDVCLPADFQLADEDCSPRLRYVDEGPSSYEDGWWLGAEALVSPLPPRNPPRAAARRRAAAADDPTWNVV
ncbi:MAG: hypothetical protein BGP24_20240 [Lysobacterales bacterium 69-70]|nr:hypothetical protein [Xanthomonadaceae bacterium]ODU35815.1 MAG: hypothetical protein ABS97_03040 [Xanthomonadaceae bacterium SCN 69-320]ODV17451.1 MAG: hypothetical protein ABT27_17045 [Xanthomonadaceae bacterium SCN 69-25]OJY97301.1 MAG: hypothetical protein BGP24_20240 [Xanthomonadales bacterium 69-70]